MAPGASVSDMTPGRRRFVKAALGAIAAVIAGVIGVPLAGFFALPALRRSERRWLEVGPVGDFVEAEIKKVLAKPLVAQVWPHETPRVALYVLNQGRGTFTLYDIHCTHVGCPVRWNVQAGRFFSPCHGGGVRQGRPRARRSTAAPTRSLRVQGREGSPLCGARP